MTTPSTSLSWCKAAVLAEKLQCKEPMDKFYGMLGIVKPSLRVVADNTLPFTQVLFTLMQKEAAFQLENENAMLRGQDDIYKIQFLISTAIYIIGTRFMTRKRRRWAIRSSTTSHRILY